MMFWDSSPIIPLCIDEPHSKTVKDAAIKDSVMAVWWWSIVECQPACFCCTPCVLRILFNWLPPLSGQARHQRAITSYVLTED